MKLIIHEFQNDGRVHKQSECDCFVVVAVAYFNVTKSRIRIVRRVDFFFFHSFNYTH